MKNKNQLALWAGLTSFFSTLLAIGTINIFDPSNRIRFVGGLFVGFITSAAVYSRQRMNDEKEGRVHGGVIRINDVGDKKVFSLELEDDPEIFENKKEVVFRVKVTSPKE